MSFRQIPWPKLGPRASVVKQSLPDVRIGRCVGPSRGATFSEALKAWRFRRYAGALTPKLDVVLGGLACRQFGDAFEGLAQHLRLHFGREDLALEAHHTHAVQELFLVD